MSKAFWEGFRDGYIRAIPYAIVFWIGFLLGVFYGLC